MSGPKPKTSWFGLACEENISAEGSFTSFTLVRGIAKWLATRVPRLCLFQGGVPQLDSSSWAPSKENTPTFEVHRKFSCDAPPPPPFSGFGVPFGFPCTSSPSLKQRETLPCLLSRQVLSVTRQFPPPRNPPPKSPPPSACWGS